MAVSKVLGAAVVGYLLGTVPSADVATKAATGGRVDIRAAGTGNPGAANAIAVLGPRWGYAVMAADIAKAVAACRVGCRLAGPLGANVAGTATVVGHCFPVWRGFRGGKGVAASAGQCLATFPAYFPVDLGVAALAGTRRFKTRARAAATAASIGWVGAAVVWWRRGWPNLWGPRPSASLPLSAGASSVVILWRFWR